MVDSSLLPSWLVEVNWSCQAGGPGERTLLLLQLWVSQSRSLGSGEEQMVSGGRRGG